jgi:hypothetical protein
LNSSLSNNITIPKSVRKLGFHSKNKIKDNIPDFIETLYIYMNTDTNDKITNLPSTIKKIKINDITRINLINKIPFGCVIKSITNNYFAR